MLRSGVVTLEAFAVAERVGASYSLSQVVDRIREHVRRGEGVAPAIAQSKLFPQYVASMVAVGEETGALDEMLERAARTLEKDIDHRMKKLLVRLEPTITTALALLVGFVVMGLYLPMFDLLGKIGR
jgi:type II secretory pathway component PulF